jgi:hypothetical protein
MCALLSQALLAYYNVSRLFTIHTHTHMLLLKTVNIFLL